MGVGTLTRKAVKPLAMLAVAAPLAVTLALSTPVASHADTIIGDILETLFKAPPIVGDTVADIAEATIVGTSGQQTNPWAWTIFGGTALAFGLYDTQDYWVPIVTGAMGDPVTENPTKPATVSFVSNWMIPGPPIFKQVLNGIDFKTSYQGNDYHYGVSATVTTTLTCKKPWGATYKAYMGWGIATGDGAYYARDAEFTTYCNDSADTMIGATVGGFGEDPNLLPRNCTNSYPACGYSNKPGPAEVRKFGSDLNVTDPGFDPKSSDVKYTTTAQCMRSDGTLFSISAESVGSDASGAAVKVPACAAAEPGAHGTGDTKVAVQVPGTTTNTTIWQAAPVPANPQYPLCGAAVPGSGCTLAVQVDGKPCVVGVWNCENWSRIGQDPAQVNRLSCQWGPYVVPLSTCNPLERAYEPDGTTANAPNTDGNPATRANTDLGGETIPQTPPASVPGAAGSLGPNGDPNARECFPSGWSMLNPVEWVLQPIRCAFEPSPESSQQLTQRVTDTIGAVGFAPISAAWLDAFSSVGGGSGCTGPTIQFNMHGIHQTLQPFNACTQPMANVAAISNGISTLAIVLFGGLGIMRAIASAFGLNFTMGSKSSGD